MRLRSCLAATCLLVTAISPGRSADVITQPGAAPGNASGNTPGTDVDITVSNIRNDKGHVLAAICTRQAFLSPHCALVGSAPARPGTVTVRVAGVPPGHYAIQVFHDENDNKTIDRNLLGLPKEGMGFSNNAPFRFGPPSYHEAEMVVGAKPAVFDIRMRYF